MVTTQRVVLLQLVRFAQEVEQTIVFVVADLVDGIVLRAFAPVGNPGEETAGLLVEGINGICLFVGDEDVLVRNHVVRVLADEARVVGFQRHVAHGVELGRHLQFFLQILQGGFHVDDGQSVFCRGIFRVAAAGCQQAGEGDGQ